ncbi:MAG: efflux RND transporter periplasmic adaptor subunit [Deltaproteobacteria bacterium]|nr:efflux RND transporter periplasmic adaptor subunit [Deltaproteobacteria bacterium]
MLRRMIGLGILLLPAVSLAHGGEDHGPPRPAPGATARPGFRVAAAQTENFELVVKYEGQHAGRPLTMRVLLSDYASNRPIEGATVELDFSGPGNVTVQAPATDASGVYEASVTFPKDGTYELVATVTATDVVDLIAVGRVETGVATVETTAEPSRSTGPWGWLEAALFVGMVGGVLTVLWRRRRSRVESAAMLMCAMFMSPRDVRAHGGDDHGDEPHVAAPALGGPIVLAKESQFLLGILTETVAERELRDRVVALGQVMPRSDRHAALFASQPGRVLPGPSGRFPYLGERVKRGQILAVVEASLSATDLAQLGSQRIRAEVRVAQVDAELQQSKRNLERVRSLEGVVATREIQEAEVSLEVAFGAYQQAVRERDLLAPTRGGGLSHFSLASPLDGVVGDTDVSPGEQVDTSRRLFVVFDPAVVWVEARVYEADLGRIERTGDARISVEAYEGASFSGSLFALAPLVDPATRTTKAVFEVPNPDGRLRPGMFAEVLIAAGQPRRALAVPDAALVNLDGKQVVFIHTGPEEFVLREVALGSRDGTYWAVRAGLSAGDRVATQGVHQLRSASR